ncbi:uncharacterized protein [Miscanthus floridulus]|uniref:uncharacterized protein n=1 Tax=Miscanthus floridulus TaxID=154761 RepID=UPI0034586611
MESLPEKWRYGVPVVDQPKLQPLIEGLERLRSRGLTVVVVVAAFHRWRVLPLMARRRRLFDMTLDEPIKGIWMSAVALSDEEILCWDHAGEPILEPIDELVPAQYWSHRTSLDPPPGSPPRRIHRRICADAAEPPRGRRAQKKKKDAEEAKRRRKNLEREELEKHRLQQRHNGLPVELSPSPSLSASSSDDDESEMGQGTLDHLPDVWGTALGASASSPAFPGGGGEDASGPAIARPRAKADTPEAWVLGKRAISPVGSTVEVEQVAGEATQQPPRRVEAALGSIEGQPAPIDMGGVPPPPPQSLQRMRGVVQKRLCPQSSQKHHAEAPALAPRKALKVSTSSTAQWVVEAQAAIQRGTVSARADPKEPVAQAEATGAATEQEEEEEPMPRQAEARGSDEAEAPSVAEVTKAEAEALRTSEAKATEAGASRTTEVEVAGAGAPGTTEAEVVEASVGVAEPMAQEAEMKAAQASVPPPVQGPPPSRESTQEVEVHSISSDDTSRGKEVADAEAASTMEQPALTPSEGSSALVRVQPEPRGWDHPRVLWRSRDDPEGQPLFALEDAAEEGCWSTFEQYRHLAERSLWTALSVMADDLPGVAQRALAVVSSHYAGVDLEAISDGYILAEDDEEATEEVTKLMEAVEGPGTALAKLFEEEVVPPMLSADAGDPEP